jgi:rod shape-determining protein MreC
VNVGERVVTSGMDRIFPRDLPVGTIAEVKPGNQFKQIRVKPAANLEKLEEVLVLLTLRPLDTSKAADPPAAKTSGPSAANVPPVAKP